MRHIVTLSLFALAACGKASDPALVDNATDAGLVSANAQNAELKRQGQVYRDTTDDSQR